MTSRSILFHRSLAIGLACALPIAALSQDDDSKKTFFLPKNPVAAAYILGRLSNKELIEAPRSEFVYIALVKRPGLDRKYRVEALQGLATLHQSSPVAELIPLLSDLDKKGEESLSVLRELSTILVQSKPEALAAIRPALGKLATDSQPSAFASSSTLEP